MVLAVGPFGLGPLELGLIVLVLVLLFGATRLADMGASLGKGIREFRKNVRDDDDEKPAETSSPTAAATPNPSVVAGKDGAATANNVVAAARCSNCGNLNPVGARHCNQCGTAIEVPVS